MLHHIQKSVLNTLASHEALRYGALKPRELDGNVFGYHLKQVMSGGYVEKTSTGDYRLTAKGRDYVVHRYEDPASSAHTIFLIVLQTGDQLLMRRRLVQPLLDKVGFIHGEPRPGETVVETAKARLLQKTGIQTGLKVAGSCLIEQYRDGELQSYSHAIILHGTVSDTKLMIDSDETGENFWLNNTSLSTEDILPSCHDILDMIETDTHWAELRYDLGN